MGMQIKSEKKKTRTRYLSYILVVIMLLSLFPVMAFADDTTSEGAIVEQEQAFGWGKVLRGSL